MSFKRLHSLMFKSAEIEQAIEREQARKAPDTIRLIKLKKLRLAIKDHIHKLARKTLGVAHNKRKKLSLTSHT